MGEAVDGGEGEELGREVGGGGGCDGAVEEVEGEEGGEGFEGCGGEGVVDGSGTVRELEGGEVSEGCGGVAEEGGGLGAWVFWAGDVEGLEGFYLLWVEREG